MKRILTVTVLLTVVLSCGSAVEVWAQSSGADQKEERPELALLGVFHLAGSTSDAAAIKLESILGKRRQREILSIVEHLEDYRPDKIMVEHPVKSQSELNKAYEKYLQDNLTLNEGETHQLAFRLGKRLGHNKLYAVDYGLDLPFEPLQKYAAEHGRKEDLQNFIANVRKRARQKEQYMEDHTILDYLRQLNTDTADLWNKNLYLGKMLTMGNDTINPGAEVAGEWYKRNIYILANMDRVLEKGDRALLIMGSGHRAILKQMIKDKSNLKYVEIHPFLK